MNFSTPPASLPFSFPQYALDPACPKAQSVIREHVHSRSGRIPLSTSHMDNDLMDALLERNGLRLLPGFRGCGIQTMVDLRHVAFGSTSGNYCNILLHALGMEVTNPNWSPLRGLLCSMPDLSEGGPHGLAREQHCMDTDEWLTWMAMMGKLDEVRSAWDLDLHLEWEIIDVITASLYLTVLLWSYIRHHDYRYTRIFSPVPYSSRTSPGQPTRDSPSQHTATLGDMAYAGQPPSLHFVSDVVASNCALLQFPAFKACAHDCPHVGHMKIPHLWVTLNSLSGIRSLQRHATTASRHPFCNGHCPAWDGHGDGRILVRNTDDYETMKALAPFRAYLRPKHHVDRPHTEFLRFQRFREVPAYRPYLDWDGPPFVPPCSFTHGHFGQSIGPNWFDDHWKQQRPEIPSTLNPVPAPFDLHLCSMGYAADKNAVDPTPPGPDHRQPRPYYPPDWQEKPAVDMDLDVAPARHAGRVAPENDLAGDTTPILDPFVIRTSFKELSINIDTSLPQRLVMVYDEDVCYPHTPRMPDIWKWGSQRKDWTYTDLTRFDHRVNKFLKMVEDQKVQRLCYVEGASTGQRWYIAAYEWMMFPLELVKAGVEHVEFLGSTEYFAAMISRAGPVWEKVSSQEFIIVGLDIGRDPRSRFSGSQCNAILDSGELLRQRGVTIWPSGATLWRTAHTQYTMSVLSVTLPAMPLATTRWLRPIETLADAERDFRNGLVVKPNVSITDSALLPVSLNEALINDLRMRWWRSSKEHSGPDLYYKHSWYAEEWNPELGKVGRWSTHSRPDTCDETRQRLCSSEFVPRTTDVWDDYAWVGGPGFTTAKDTNRSKSLIDVGLAIVADEEGKPHFRFILTDVQGHMGNLYVRYYDELHPKVAHGLVRAMIKGALPVPASSWEVLNNMASIRSRAHMHVRTREQLDFTFRMTGVTAVMLPEQVERWNANASSLHATRDRISIQDFIRDRMNPQISPRSPDFNARSKFAPWNPPLRELVSNIGRPPHNDCPPPLLQCWRRYDHRTTQPGRLSAAGMNIGGSTLRSDCSPIPALARMVNPPCAGCGCGFVGVLWTQLDFLLPPTPMIVCRLSCYVGDGRLYPTSPAMRDMITGSGYRLSFTVEDGTATLASSRALVAPVAASRVQASSFYSNYSPSNTSGHGVYLALVICIVDTSIFVTLRPTNISPVPVNVIFGSDHESRPSPGFLKHTHLFWLGKGYVCRGAMVGATYHLGQKTNRPEAP
ncbi:hypothetical protein BDZ89DRAFT_1050071 [Hymenopellis radicata]|nr:hypothetical protein BDZ89DRAFT_1050071 [Hymenopellis radicata]